MHILSWLIAIVVSAAAGYWVYRSDKRRGIPMPWLTALLRGLVLFFTLLLILAPAIEVSHHTTEKPVVVLLQDNSRSIATALGKDSATYRQQMESLTRRLSDKYKVVQWGFGQGVQPDSLYQYKQSATDISAALAQAQEYYGLQNLGAVILATDGRFNQGTNPLYQPLSLPGSLYTVAIGDSAKQKDIRIAATYANKTVTINSSFEIRADIVAELCRGYSNSVVIREENETLSSAPVSVSTDRYDRSVSFTLKATKAGLHHYVMTVPDAEGEQNTANNRKDIFIEVIEEKKNILIASAAPHPDVNAIRDALAGLEMYKVTIVTADNIPNNLGDYQVIILHSLPSQRRHIAAQIVAAKKPVWLITGGQAEAGAINELQPITHTTITQGMQHDVLPVYNGSFNAFLLPRQVQSVTDKMPPLVVNTSAITTAPGANVLFYQKTAAGQVPLWVMQQGTTPTAVLAGEGVWRWRLYEYKNFNEHNVVDECIRQTIAFLSANNAERPFTVQLPKHIWSDQEAISMNAYLLNTNNEQVNTPDVQLTIADSGRRKEDYSFERSGTAYMLNIGIHAGGSYNYTARTTYNDKPYTASGTFVVESTPLEFMETGADYPMLFAMARKYNGALFPANNFTALYDSIVRNERVKPMITTNTETVPLVDRKWFFFLILLIAVAEWLLRKYWLAQ
jgi:hypothetical protein